jgi:hypothetical protein
MERISQIAIEVEKGKQPVDSLVHILNELLDEMSGKRVERYLPKRKFVNANERLDAFLKIVAQDIRTYENERNMNEATIRRHVDWLKKLSEELNDLQTMLHDSDLMSLLNAVEDLYPRNFYSGTGYGTCYGARPVLHFVNNVKAQLQFLNTSELHSAYIFKLHKLWTTRATNYRVIPLESLLQGDTDGLFPYEEIRGMNQKIRNANSPDAKLKIISRLSWK